MPLTHTQSLTQSEEAESVFSGAHYGEKWLSLAAKMYVNICAFLPSDTPYHVPHSQNSLQGRIAYCSSRTSTTRSRARTCMTPLAATAAYVKYDWEMNPRLRGLRLWCLTTSWMSVIRMPPPELR